MVEVTLEGDQGPMVVYSDEKGQFLLVGDMLDVKSKRNLTRERMDKLTAVKWDTLPLKDAIKVVRGNGQRKLAVFSDPDCPYCKRLAKSLAKVENVTIYTFLMPLDELHPEARKRSAAVWCAHDRGSAWLDLMERGIDPKAPKLDQKPGQPASKPACDTPLDRNLELASRLGVRGTPALFSEDGRAMAGAGSTEQLERFLVPPVSTSATERRP
jgi:thiol:disulfide interchange protein DsbC